MVTPLDLITKIAALVPPSPPTNCYHHYGAPASKAILRVAFMTFASAGLIAHACSFLRVVESALRDEDDPSLDPIDQAMFSVDSP